MVTGQALLCVLKQHWGVPSMWPNDLLHVNYDDILHYAKTIAEDRFVGRPYTVILINWRDSTQLVLGYGS